MASKTCPDTCPACGADLKADGYPTGHQDEATGDPCTFRWDTRGAYSAETDD
jgi:hypothetical protein